MAAKGVLNSFILATPPSSFMEAPSDRLVLMGQPLRHSSPNISGKEAVQKRCVVISRRLSGLEEAMRIQRLREFRSSVKIRKRPLLRRGKVSARLPVPEHIPRPPYVGSNMLPELSSEYQVHDDDGIARMKAACELAARVLDFAGTLVRCTRLLSMRVLILPHLVMEDFQKVSAHQSMSACAMEYLIPASYRMET